MFGLNIYRMEAFVVYGYDEETKTFFLLGFDVLLMIIKGLMPDPGSQNEALLQAGFLCCFNMVNVGQM